MFTAGHFIDVLGEEMITEVEMKRELFGVEIRQKSKSEFLSATQLVKAGNKWRVANNMTPFNLSQWMGTRATQDFISELEERHGKAYIKGRGRNSQTWFHPYLFIDLALAISPTLKIEVYGWLFDHLLKNRNDSGDSYKKMCGVLVVRHRNQRTFQDMIQKLALKIQRYCGVRDWQLATEEQLAMRNKIHEDIALLADVMNNNDEAIRIVFEKMNKKILEKASQKGQLNLLG
jgi:hypothetical protein